MVTHLLKGVLILKFLRENCQKHLKVAAAESLTTRGRLLIAENDKFQWQHPVGCHKNQVGVFMCEHTQGRSVHHHKCDILSPAVIMRTD